MKHVFSWGRIAWVAALMALMFIVLFGYFTENIVLLTTDAAISNSNRSWQEVAFQMVASWRPERLLGNPSGSATQIASLLRAGMGGIVWNNLVYGTACLFASFCFLCVFSRKMNAYAVLLGALVAFWLGSNFTLLIAGHNFKPYVALFFVCSLILTKRAAQGSIPYANLWGGCAGLMFAQQPDIAMFFSPVAGGYFIFHLCREQGVKPFGWLKVMIPAALVAFLIASGQLFNGYTYAIKGAAQMQVEDPQAKWEYVTQWSFPPEETIAFVAPGYTGWRSNEPDGPYWGRMGRSAGWEETGQGFRNFKLESTYLGFIPVAFALFALFSCWRSKHRAEILFWSIAALLTLLLAFGKFTPLYALFYKLPVVNNIRNPNKFLQVLQVCLGILTAYGFDALFRSDEPKAVRKFFWMQVGTLGLLLLWSLSASMNFAGTMTDFTARGWPHDAAEMIAVNKMKALWHASFMGAVIAAVFAVFSFSRFGKLLRYKSWIAVGLVLIVATDAVKLSKHYVTEMPRSYIAGNALTDFLKENLGHQRVALLSQQGIYGIWTTYLLPYNQIPTFNFSDMPRMASDYQTFLEAGQRNPLNMWRFSAVKYLLGPAVAEGQLAGQARKVFAYDLASAPNNGFQIIARPQGQHAVFELLDSSPRYAVVAPPGPLSNEQALAMVTKSPRPQIGAAKVLSYRPGNVELLVTADAPAVLRVAEKWDADWKAFVDGEPVEVERVDFICQGVSVPAGEHTVELHYAPSRLFFYMQGAGYLIFFVSLITVSLRRKEAHAAD